MFPLASGLLISSKRPHTPVLVGVRFERVLRRVYFRPRRRTSRVPALSVQLGTSQQGRNVVSARVQVNATGVAPPSRQDPPLLRRSSQVRSAFPTFDRARELACTNFLQLFNVV